ncbi:DciA family protein [Streptomyces sp. NPDC058985]|uniref:DciA family protein n=1 Tax=Streptomyces sp. NPDC058985 TaxID=3346684 RepID=UPI003680A2F8
MSQQPSGIDLARAALAAARADAKTRPTQPQRKKRTTTSTTARRHGDPMGLGAAINRMMTERAWQPPETGGSILDQWPTIAPELANKVAAVRFEHDTGTLHLRPASDAYGTQLRLRQPQILARIQQNHTGRSVHALKILTPGAAAPAHTEPALEPEKPTEPAPVRTRETASPGYRQALAAALDNRPAPPPVNPYLEEARQRQIAALRANRQPESEHRDGVWEVDRLETAARAEREAVRQTAINRARHERAGGTTPRRALDVA